MSEKVYISRSEVARLLGVSPSTITRWARRGRLPSVETLGGHRRYPREAVLELRGRLQRDAGLTRTVAALAELEPSALGVGREGRTVEVRIHGRAGQGLITVGELLAEAALEEGKYFQAFPEFGAERTGAPMEAFVRLGDRPIDIHASVLEPDVVLVIDPTLLGQVPVFRGVPPGGLAVINEARDPQALAQGESVPPHLRVVTVDATAIALEEVRRAVPNIPVLGALLRARRLVSPELMARLIRDRMARRISQAVADANVAAFWRGYNEARLGPIPGGPGG